jgi:hypothetical protein
VLSSRPAGYWLRPILVVLCLSFVTCGSVGEPLPPLLHVPGHVDDFSVRQDIDDLVAGWTWPVRGSEGQIFRKMERFEIYAAYIPSGGAIPSTDAFNASDDVVRIIAVETTETTGPGLPLSVRAPLDARYGSCFGFSIRGVSDRGKVSAWSAVKVLDVVRPPVAPSRLQVETIEQGVRLRWSGVEDAADYQVERRVGGEEFVSIGQPVTPEFVDAEAVWNSPSAYRVRARKLAGESPVVVGVPSTRFEVVPRDTFAPATPRNLRAIATDVGVELSWSSNMEMDLAGYRVLQEGSPIHDGLLESANYSAPAIPTGQTVLYQVVSVDLSDNASVTAEVRASAPR